MIQFSLVTKNNGILTKRFDLKDGELVKDSSQCFLKTGSIETIDMEFRDLPEFLDSLKENQAILHGISIHSPSKLVAKGMLDKNPKAMARTKDNFFWPDRGIVMFDYDPPEGKEPLEKKKLLETIRGLHPELKKAAIVWRPSASSNIVGKDGKIYRGLNNQRVYVEYSNPDNMDSFVKNLEKAAWDKGLGHIFITAAGTALPRCIFDTAVFSPERLDFAAGAVCGDGLKPQIIKSTYEEGDVVDLDEIGTLYDDQRYAMQVEEAKRDVSVDIVTARNKYKEQQADRLLHENPALSRSKANKIVGSRLKNKIMPNDIIFDNKNVPIKVMDIILDSEKYNGMVIRDPLEPEYGASKAKIFADNESITINSFAHGGRVFRILLDAECYIELLKQVDDPEELLDIWRDRMRDFSGSQADRETVAKHVSKKTGVSKTTLIKDIKAKEKEIKEEREEEKEQTDLSHHQIADRILAQLPKHTVSSEGSLYVYNGANVWAPMSLTEMELEVAKRFDCLPRCSRKSDYSQIARHWYNMVEDPKFFSKGVPVIATLDGVHLLQEDGTVKMVPHDPKYRVRFLLPFKTVPRGTPSPLVDLYTSQTFAGEEIQKLVLYEFYGATFFGVATQRFHKALLLRGDGQNGKSVAIEILANMIPSKYISNVSPYQFGDPLYLAELNGKMYNQVAELNKGQKLPNAAFKRVIDEGQLLAKRLYQPPFYFTSIASHIYSSNYPIKTDDGSGAMRRRWEMLRFRHKVKDEDKIFHLGRILAQEEGPQIFNYALEGIERLIQQNHFTWTPSKEALNREMFLETDSLQSFLGDEDVIQTDTTHGDYKVLRSGLYKHYREWCRSNTQVNQEVHSKSRFNSKLEELGYDLVRLKGQLWWRGIKLNTAGI